MRKKTISIFLIFCMAISMMSCSGENKDVIVDSEKAKTDEVIEKNNQDEIVQENSEIKSDESTKIVEQSDLDSDINLIVAEEYKNLPESKGFLFESNGDGTCTLKEIGDCTDLDIVIPEKSPAGDTITEIYEYAFYDAEDINSIIFAGRNMELDNNAFQSCEAKKIIISGCNLTIGENAFAYSEDIEEINISNSIVEIDDYAFYDTGDHTAVVFTDSKIELDDNVFQSSNLITLNISGCETVMGENTFGYCDKLTDVMIGAANIEIGSYSFYDCGDLVNVSIAADSEDDAIIIELDEDAFQSSSVQNVVIGKGQVEIGDSGFSYCEDLKNVEFKGTSLDIGDSVFYDCPAELVISFNGKTYNKESIEELN